MLVWQAAAMSATRTAWKPRSAMSRTVSRTICSGLPPSGAAGADMGERDGDGGGPDAGADVVPAGAPFGDFTAGPISPPTSTPPMSAIRASSATVKRRAPFSERDSFDGSMTIRRANSRSLTPVASITCRTRAATSFCCMVSHRSHVLRKPQRQCGGRSRFTA